MAGGILNPLTALVLLFIVVGSYHFFPLAAPTCETFYFPIRPWPCVRGLTQLLVIFVAILTIFFDQ